MRGYRIIKDQEVRIEAPANAGDMVLTKDLKLVPASEAVATPVSAKKSPAPKSVKTPVSVQQATTASPAVTTPQQSKAEGTVEVAQPTSSTEEAAASIDEPQGFCSKCSIM